jgi:hypothetical protein
LVQLFFFSQYAALQKNKPVLLQAYKKLTGKQKPNKKLFSFACRWQFDRLLFG